MATFPPPCAPILSVTAVGWPATAATGIASQDIVVDTGVDVGDGVDVGTIVGVGVDDGEAAVGEGEAHTFHLVRFVEESKA